MQCFEDPAPFHLVDKRTGFFPIYLAVTFTTFVHAPLMRTSPPKCKQTENIILVGLPFPTKSIQWEEGTSFGGQLVILATTGNKKLKDVGCWPTKHDILILKSQIVKLMAFSTLIKERKCLRKWHMLRLVEMSYSSNLVLLWAKTCRFEQCRTTSEGQFLA